MVNEVFTMRGRRKKETELDRRDLLICSSAQKKKGKKKKKTKKKKTPNLFHAKYVEKT